MIGWLERMWARASGRRVGWSMQCFTGKEFWPLDPRAADVCVDDIAHGLANLCRYSGQCLDYYSVAEHSVIVSAYVESEARAAKFPEFAIRAWALEGLLHDAAEAYVGDLLRPFRASRGMRWFGRVEERVQDCVWEHFSTWLLRNGRSAQIVKTIDDRVLIDEMSVLICDADLAALHVKYGAGLGASIACMDPAHAEQVWITRFDELCPEYC